MRTFISVSEALHAVLDHCSPLPTEVIPLDQSLGRTLALDVRSDEMIPPFDNAAMDGYAVRTDDIKTVPMEFPVWDEVPAGKMLSTPLPEQVAVRIMTGAPLPPEADAVVPREQVEEMGADRRRVRFLHIPARDQHVRRAGEDVRPGQLVFRAGERITPPVVGMLAGLGVVSVPVARSPSVQVIATGSELVDAAHSPGPGSIRDSNGPALCAQARACGADPVERRLVHDDAHALGKTLSLALDADVVVVSGGVSVGDYDHVKEVLTKLGVDLVFWKVRQRPGKPLTFGVRGNTLVFGLPGNPVSSAVCFDQYVRPALLALQARRALVRPRTVARLTEPIHKAAGLHHFVRGIAAFDNEMGPIVRPTGPQGSNLYSSMVVANCLIHVGEGMENPPPGSAVEFEWLDW